MMKMKKIWFAVAVFCGVFTLAGAELSVGGWKIHTGQGKFTYNVTQYPLLISCQTPTADKDGNLGVWGRVYRVEKLETGKKYEIKVTYKLTDSPKGAIAVWVRGADNFNLFGRASANAKTLQRQFTASKENVSIYINLREGTGNLEVISAELNPVE